MTDEGRGAGKEEVVVCRRAREIELEAEERGLGWEGGG